MAGSDREGVGVCDVGWSRVGQRVGCGEDISMISANERRTIWTQEHREQYERAEALIDSAIRRSEDDTVTVDISSATSSRRVLERLRDAYGEGGWIVSVSPIDGRDPGLFLTLRVAGAPCSGPGVG